MKTRTTNKNLVTLVTALAACAASPHFAAAASATAEVPPNVLIILADDMGYGDVGFNGCTDIPTPHMDTIAANGVCFTDGYVTAPQCGPSRAGLLTGMYQNRLGIEENADIDPVGFKPGIKLFGDYLHPAGYRTGIVGKWRFPHPPHCHVWGIRRGEYKLVAEVLRNPTGRGWHPDRSGKTGLYNLAGDIHEDRDLSDQFPEVRQQLQNEWDAWNAGLPEIKEKK